jgi:serine/threonine protein kinase
VNDACEACIIDFGVSRELDFSDFTTKPVLLELRTPSSDKENIASLDTATSGVGGTRRWMACELLAPANGLAERTLQTTVATDIWAFGMTALEVISSAHHYTATLTHVRSLIQVFSGHLPFHQVKHDATVILSVMTGSRPKHETYPTISHHIWFLLELCWHADPTQRPSMQSLSIFFKTQIHPDNLLPAITNTRSGSPLGPVNKHNQSCKCRVRDNLLPSPDMVYGEWILCLGHDDLTDSDS